MEFLLINHPLDCPICDQAGECGLQDYSYKHGQAFSRFRFEEKRTYPEKERIPLGPTVMLNMNRCIQCTRCIRFTEEIAKTSELGFFERGSHAEIGTFPGKPLDNPLSTCVVDICPVGALTSTRFRFAERVWYLDKNPSICTGCDVGCNITLEHKHGAIKRYKPRQNPEVNDFWMCDFGRSTHERYRELPRLAFPQIRRNGELAATGWKEAIDHVAHNLRSRRSEGVIAFLGSGFLSTEEAFLLAKIAAFVESPHRSIWVDSGPARHIPNPQGGIDRPRRGAEPPRRRACRAGSGLRRGEQRGSPARGSSRQVRSDLHRRQRFRARRARSQGRRAPARGEVPGRDGMGGLAARPRRRRRPAGRHARRARRHVRQCRLAGAALRAGLRGAAAGPAGRRGARRSALAFRSQVVDGHARRRSSI